MNLHYNFFKVSDGQSLAYKVWDKVETPLGVIILIHGMAEHIERYDHFSKYLNSIGFIVYGTDQRGHGKTSGKKGIFTYDKSWKRVIEDQEEFYNFVRSNHPELDLSFFAHSMGSYICRSLLAMKQLKVKKVLISGTGFEPALKTAAAIPLAKMICNIKGPGQDAILLDKMVNDPFAASIENPVTSFDWLSRDAEEVSKYVNDSNCGFICTNKFYYDFFQIVSYACKKSSIKRLNKKIPIMLYSGDSDPVGGRDINGVKTLYNIKKRAGIDVTLEINPGGRHESINETNKDEVYSTIGTFFKN